MNTYHALPHVFLNALSHWRRVLTRAGFMLLLISVSGCSTLIANQTSKLANNLSSAILDNDDLQVVADGAPAYLIMIDGLIKNSPKNDSLLRAGSSLNGAYASAFVTDSARRLKMTEKSLAYAAQAACLEIEALCGVRTLKFNELSAILDQQKQSAVPALYTLGTAWAGWIQTRSNDWTAIGGLANVKGILETVIALDEGYENGNAHLYLGVLGTVLPPALGGKPEVGAQHFQKAIELSQERNLIAKVFYAQNYARLVFDRELHDQLLNQVIAADPNAKGFVLMNTVAQQQARDLLASANDYF